MNTLFYENMITTVENMFSATDGKSYKMIMHNSGKVEFYVYDGIKFVECDEFDFISVEKIPSYGDVAPLDEYMNFDDAYYTVEINDELWITDEPVYTDNHPDWAKSIVGFSK